MKTPTWTSDAVRCPLERLPVEIQTRILVESSLDSLPAIIRSSPRFLHVYSQNRLSVLRNILSSSLEGFFPDAYVACTSDPYFRVADTNWWHLRHEYLENPDIVPPSLDIAGISLETIQQMAYFHLRVVEPLTERYCRWALGALSSSPLAAPLTKTEKSRIQRAMYRLQVVCNLRVREPQEMLSVLDSFGPWATEQILCVHEFAKERFSSAFIECAWVLDPMYNNLGISDDWKDRLRLYKNEGESITRYPCSCVVLFTDLCSPDLNVKILCDVLSSGLSVLQETFQAEDFEDLCDVIRNNVEYYGELYLGCIFEGIDEAGKYKRIPCTVLTVTVRVFMSPLKQFSLCVTKSNILLREREETTH